MEEEEEEEEEEKEEIDGISSRRRGSRGGRGNRGGARVGKSRSGKREENKNKEDDKKNIRYKVKIQVNLKAGIIPTISEIKSTLNGAQNIRKKIVKKGSDRIHEAMNELKLLKLKEIKKNQKFFKLKN